MKILVIFGTRPEAIKLAPVIHELEKSNEYQVVVASSGQHKEMLHQTLSFFEIVPDYDLKLMNYNQSVASLSSKMIRAFEGLFSQVAPNLCIVQGDTTTTFIAALSSFYNKFPVAHVEAGLRSFNKLSPYPEEINRVLTTHLSDYHFAPTKISVKNLYSHGIPKKQVFLTGNTSIDALLYTRKKLEKSSDKLMSNIFRGINFNKPIVLITAHRRENFGKPLINICQAILDLAKDNNLEFVYPVHLNPNVKNTVNSLLANKPNIHLLTPLRYEEFVFLMDKSYIILTDSGGIQEEAPSLKKPVLVMREVTERIEGIEEGVTKLVGTTKKNIVNGTRQLIYNKSNYKIMATGVNPYGDGNASVKIGKIINRIKNDL